MMSEQAIGLFDSGVGGLTVFREIASVLPNEHLVYFGDTARMPYGEKSGSDLKRFALENASFLMQKHPLKMLIVACNTAAAYCYNDLPNFCPFPVINVIEAGVRTVVKQTKDQRIAVLGTRGTIRSGIYEQEILKKLPRAHVTSLACPLLAPLVEEQFMHHEAARLIVREYLKKLRDIDTLLLGCTHYPLLRHLFEEEMGPEVAIVDSASSCADMVLDIIQSRQLGSQKANPLLSFYVSDDPQRFSLAAQNYLGFIPNVALAK